jgi:chromosome segregation ATPase
MIQKIRELMAVKEQIDVIKNNLNYATNSVGELKNEITSLKQHVDDNASNINSKNDEFLKNFNENLDLIKGVRKDFEKELFDFKLLRAQMQKKIIEKFEEELDKELRIQMEKLRKDNESYNEIKGEISEVNGKIGVLGQEISKFISISSNIKKEDFELTKFAHNLLELDKEKLELMRKIDTLERLVSKIRRQEYATR